MRQALIGLTATVVLAVSSQVAAPQKPNIVFILMDNLGYGEVVRSLSRGQE